jgi:hypothetical protein
MNDKGMHIKLSSELYNALHDAAKRKNISLASLVRIFCTEGLERASGVSMGNNIETVSADDISVDEIFAALPSTTE